MYQGNGQTEALPISNNPKAERIVDGRVKAGDVGRLDADGRLYMLDHAHDTVISGGFTIVIEVSVFGEASVTEKERVELCAGHKIRRKELREPFLVGRERSVAGD